MEEKRERDAESDNRKCQAYHRRKRGEVTSHLVGARLAFEAARTAIPATRVSPLSLSQTVGVCSRSLGVVRRRRGSTCNVDLLCFETFFFTLFDHAAEWLVPTTGVLVGPRCVFKPTSKQTHSSPPPSSSLGACVDQALGHSLPLTQQLTTPARNQCTPSARASATRSARLAQPAVTDGRQRRQGEHHALRRLVKRHLLGEGSPSRSRSRARARDGSRLHRCPFEFCSERRRPKPSADSASFRANAGRMEDSSGPESATSERLRRATPAPVGTRQMSGRCWPKLVWLWPKLAWTRPCWCRSGSTSVGIRPRTVLRTPLDSDPALA